VAKVKARARPLRSIFLLVLAVIMAAVSRSARAAAASVTFPEKAFRALGHTGTEAVAVAAAAAFCLLASVVLLLARPVDLGERVWIKSGPLGGELRGTVTEIGITYVRLDTPDGPLHLPNSQVLASAIAPVVSSPPDRT
jgi:Mechanosensitive ion channel